MLARATLLKVFRVHGSRGQDTRKVEIYTLRSPCSVYDALEGQTRAYHCWGCLMQSRKIFARPRREVRPTQFYSAVWMQTVYFAKACRRSSKKSDLPRFLCFRKQGPVDSRVLFVLRCHSIISPRLRG